MQYDHMPPWPEIDTVLLDMDGTLLDLYFDWHFWWEYLPKQYARHHGMTEEEATKRVRAAIREQAGTLNWYCIDHWTQCFQLPIAELKRNLKHLIRPHPGVETFLARLRQWNKRLALATNAHHDSLSLKLEETAIGRWFDAILCVHDYGMPKEDPRIWEAFRRDFPFDPARTLLIDDNLTALESARQYGIRHLLVASHVSPHMPPVKSDTFPSFTRFETITPPPPPGA